MSNPPIKMRKKEPVMKFNISHLTTVCLITTGLVLTDSAQALTAQQQMDQELQQVLVQTQKLQQQINYLNGEVKQLQREKTVAQQQVRQAQRQIAQQQVVQQTVQQRQIAHQQALVQQTQNTAAQLTPGEHAVLLNKSKTAPEGVGGPTIQYVGAQSLAAEAAKPHHGAKYIVMQTQGSPVPVATSSGPIPTWLQGERLTQGITVTTSPLLGLRSAYDASDLVVNISTMNEDLRLLQQREKLETQLLSEHVRPLWADRSLIELSGALESQGVFRHPFSGNASSDIDLTRAEFDTLAFFSSSVLGLLSMSYDNSPLPANIQGAGQREANSRIFLRRGFVTVGELGITPFYFSIGQMFIPFGIYTSEMLSSPMTQSIGQTNQRTALLGFYDEGLYSSIYAFHGNTTSNSINNGGANLGYQYNGDKFSANVGGGYLINLADSLGLQSTGNPIPNSFQGFGLDSSTENIAHKVSGVDAHGELDIGKLTLLAEYVGSAGSFATQDLSYNGDGARPQAVHLEGDYSIKAFDKWPTIFTLAYGRSWEALGVNVPKDSYVAEVNTSFWKNTIETIELRHDINYSSSDTFSGEGFPVPVNSSGGTQTTVIAQLGAYF